MSFSCKGDASYLPLVLVEGRLSSPDGRRRPSAGSGRRLHLSLSRLNHWLPGSEAHPEIVQSTAEVHHQIADAFLPQADPVFDDASAPVLWYLKLATSYFLARTVPLAFLVDVKSLTPYHIAHSLALP